MMVFTFLKRFGKQFNQAKAEETPPEWVTCIWCGLELPSEEAGRWKDFEDGTVYTHPMVDGNYSCQQPFYREREVGRLKKPLRLFRRLPIWK
jgi:hypothetical protein